MHKEVVAITAVVAGFLLVAATEERPSTEQAKKALGAAAGRALQGQASEAVTLLSVIPAEQFGPKEGVIRDCIIERFGPGSLPPQIGLDSTLTGRAISAYRSYWWSALKRPETQALAEGELQIRLRKLLRLPGNADVDAIEEALRTRIATEGFHALVGRTPPLLELMVWKSETEEIRDVPLPEGRHRVSVKFLDQFSSLGWAAFATCDHGFTGGWVQPDAIYAVGPGWKDLAGENFIISFVAHETQHFADKKRLGDLEPWELEYRAKLTELALANTTLPKLLGAFQSNQSSDRDLPHSYANALVLARLKDKLGRSSSDLSSTAGNAINATAHALLVEDTARRVGNVAERRPGAE